MFNDLFNVLWTVVAEQASKLSDITIQWKELQKDRKYSDTELQKALSGKCHSYR